MKLTETAWKAGGVGWEPGAEVNQWWQTVLPGVGTFSLAEEEIVWSGWERKNVVCQSNSLESVKMEGDKYWSKLTGSATRSGQIDPEPEPCCLA